MSEPTIRRATVADIPELDRLLHQVLEVHHAGRPDLFKGGVTKYTAAELAGLIASDETPIFVAVAGNPPTDEAADSPVAAEPTNGDDARAKRAGSGSNASDPTLPAGAEPILGYAFCQFQRHPNDNILTDITTLYVDDICVDETARGRHVGSALYHHALAFAKESGCHNLTLNVWSCNPGAQAFYERMGLTPYRIGMEQIL
ncbi:GNAT family N-acetyltransferase [Bifidobacterium eulemuris]|uniref:GNAT family N-acetyltransferase n=1 Tax=Bifidobacterium eulemuris TaxID=1765219 RepID=A0A261GD97_9BIFI|nr:GNAT family N-acetyltransferase [Bifidobacterium eulemuris]OZG68946.1 GNAT family acetyltransferase [Bifidobacterium eulemuris]QOL31518.1 GNAT family N-acetyltransferase [Bifidobacterium eulemuris]